MNLAVVLGGYFVISAVDKKPMSKLRTSAFIADAHLVEQLAMYCVQIAKSINVLHSQIIVMARSYYSEHAPMVFHKAACS